jgi:hypothetical protein
MRFRKKGKLTMLPAKDQHSNEEVREYTNLGSSGLDDNKKPP